MKENKILKEVENFDKKKDNLISSIVDEYEFNLYGGNKIRKRKGYNFPKQKGKKIDVLFTFLVGRKQVSVRQIGKKIEYYHLKKKRWIKIVYE